MGCVAVITSSFITILFSFGAEFAATNATELNIIERFSITRDILVCLNVVFCTFLLASSATGLVLLKRAHVSQENIVGLQKLLGVSIALFVATVFQSTIRIMTWQAGWILPEWFEYGLGNIFFYAVTFVALLYFVFSVIHSKYISTQFHSAAVEMSEKLLSNESGDSKNSVPKAYMI